MLRWSTFLCLALPLATGTFTPLAPPNTLPSSPPPPPAMPPILLRLVGGDTPPRGVSRSFTMENGARSVTITSMMMMQAWYAIIWASAVQARNERISALVRAAYGLTISSVEMLHRLLNVWRTIS